MFHVKWLVETMEQCKAEPCIFRSMVNKQVPLVIGVHVDDIIMSREKDACDALLDKLKESFPVKHQGKLKMYTVVRSCGTGSLV